LPEQYYQYPVFQEDNMNLPGGWELIVIVIVIIIFFGGPKIKDAIKEAGKTAFKVKKEIDDIKDITKK
jgi:Sec-independent protein translocase protein TatA